jgi:hypothetical protein
MYDIHVTLLLLTSIYYSFKMYSLGNKNKNKNKQRPRNWVLLSLFKKI